MRFADRRKTVIVVVGSVLVTGSLVALVLSLGSWAYQTRRFLLHERRLAKLLEEHPPAADVSAALLADPGNRLFGVPRTEEELIGLTSRWSGALSQEVIEKRRAASEVHVFGVSDMVYVLFFGADGRLQSYVLLSS